MSSSSFTRLVKCKLPVDLSLTLWPLRRGFGDPTMREERDGSWWRATRTPDGPATTRLMPGAGGILVRAYGPGAEWALDGAPDLLGASDSLDGFDPPRGVIRELHRRMPVLHLIAASGIGAPRFGPRQPLQEIAKI